MDTLHLSVWQQFKIQDKAYFWIHQFKDEYMQNHFSTTTTTASSLLQRSLTKNPNVEWWHRFWKLDEAYSANTGATMNTTSSNFVELLAYCRIHIVAQCLKVTQKVSFCKSKRKEVCLFFWKSAATLLPRFGMKNLNEMIFGDFQTLCVVLLEQLYS